MKILVDHGAFGNLGDIAMLESVVFRLRIILPQAELFVMQKPGLKSPIWDLPQVSKLQECSIRPFWDDIFDETRFFWRLQDDWHKLSYKLTFQSIGTLMPAGSISLFNGENQGIPHDNLGKFCEEFDALHIVGGGNITDVFLNELLNKCGFIHVFSEQGKPIILTGQQIGPFRSWSSKMAFQKALRKVNFIGLREPTDSLRFCMETHIEPNRYAIMGDDSLGLMPLDEASLSDFLSGYGLHEGDFIAANIRIAPYAKEHADYLEKIALIIERIAMHFHKPVVIIPTALNPSDSDIFSGKILADAGRHVGMVVLDSDNLSPALVKGILGKSSGAIGVSYHFCIFALSQGVPAVCLYDGAYYSQKAKGICAFWGDKRLSLALEDIDVDSGTTHIMNLFEDELFQEKMYLFGKEAIERWQHQFDTQTSQYFGRLS